MLAVTLDGSYRTVVSTDLEAISQPSGEKATIQIESE